MALRLFAVLLFLVLGTSWGMAQAVITGEPLPGSTDAVTTQEEDTGTQILVIGDALGGGLGAGLTRMVENEDGFDVTLRFNEESGVARPEVYDWGETLPKILEGKDYDAVVVLLGANDRQTIRSGDMRYDFGTPEWTSAYRAQTDRILNALAAANTKIYWVSLPPMADPDYDAAMKAILSVQKEEAEARGASFVDIRAAFLNADGTYTDQGPDDTGAVRKLRSRDGVTFFKQGNNRMAQLVLEAIKQGGGAAPRGDLPTVSGAEPTPGAVAAQEGDVPLFGGFGVMGENVFFHPTDIGVAALVASGTGAVAVQSLTLPGSAAERLFVSGEAAPAPKGRADDFSLPR